MASVPLWLLLLAIFLVWLMIFVILVELFIRTPKTSSDTITLVVGVVFLTLLITALFYLAVDSRRERDYKIIIVPPQSWSPPSQRNFPKQAWNIDKAPKGLLY